MGYYDSVYSEELPHRAISVYMYLKERADKKSQCYPAMSILSQKNFSRQRAVGLLENWLVKDGSNSSFYEKEQKRIRPRKRHSMTP